jgi:hypothetical protein
MNVHADGPILLFLGAGVVRAVAIESAIKNCTKILAIDAQFR